MGPWGGSDVTRKRGRRPYPARLRRRCAAAQAPDGRANLGADGEHGRYKIVRKSPTAGWRRSFLARQHGSEGFQKPVVLKRIHTTFYADPQFRNMLVDEAHISMSLYHSNIVQVLDLGRAGRPLVSGARAGRRLGSRARCSSGPRQRARPLPPELALYITAEVCRALSYAHSRTRPTASRWGSSTATSARTTS